MYYFFKLAASVALPLYTKKTIARFHEPFVANQPTILASNHPNSFFDAVLIAIHYPQPIYFLARGDVFKKPLVAKFLKALHLIPIYRLSEGKENLSKNDDTFQTCIDLLQQNQTILIFSEGICKNEWQLRPLKKGTARLALMAAEAGLTNVRIQPTAINYSSFRKNPKEIEIHFNQSFSIDKKKPENEAVYFNDFNQKLKISMTTNLLVKSDTKDIALFPKQVILQAKLIKYMVAIPAFVGFLANYGIYFTVKKIALRKTKNTVFYDSVLFGILLLFYPILVAFLAIITGVLFNWSAALILFIGMPLSAWFYKTYKSL
ncbi:1-acyl-sn-glycerol-3-phosphate acyltransferase [Flavobacterium glaciei]|uniref:1-acyl-sn-glycerol-3-phosphate acyltransferase n=1 Tax=Flavobacterium glaciei TaxID=386300 RepID=A0A562Q5Q0_9FLAO|nr:1-acyl-sn-glycerol-3-phosphate acyltransferase [Flavobacterium glaciei]RDI58298.1 1-acyl-sn-glycerol-3-phosphate acyltransferase [Flavobacterium glaciei]TWI52085.1 1-acyl-sn-glycerol-3-phosphate acyltransferase [Flavobacterium glaciei]